MTRGARTASQMSSIDGSARAKRRAAGGAARAQRRHWHTCARPPRPQLDRGHNKRPKTKHRRPNSGTPESCRTEVNSKCNSVQLDPELHRYGAAPGAKRNCAALFVPIRSRSRDYAILTIPALHYTAVETYRVETH